MENLLLYSKILYGTLLPRNRDLNTSQKYLQLLNELDIEVYQFQPLFELNFLKTFDPKRKYFSAIIEGEARCFLNHFNQLMGASTCEVEKNLLVSDVLRNIDEKLKRTAFLIRDKGPQSATILPPHHFYLPSEVCLDDSLYIFQFMKFELIRLYLELQERYAPYTGREVLSEEDIHQVYFGTTKPEQSFIVKIEPKFSQALKPSSLLPHKKAFQARMHEIRPSVPGVLKYEDIVADPIRFARFEQELFDQLLIDHEYEFQRKPQGNVSKMAAVYHVSFQHVFYKKQYFKGKQRVPLTVKDVQAFLNRRYNVHIDREFRNFNKQEKLDNYLEDKQWIPLLVRF